MAEKLYFASDYMEGAHPNILKRLSETNMEHFAGYGTDEITNGAKERIREACQCPDAEVEFLVGGTQTNATVIAAFLRTFEGVVAAENGHVAVHEAGAVEYTGHKVLTLPAKEGKLEATVVKSYLDAWEKDESRDHTVVPGMVYISQPTEFGTLYSLKELEGLKTVCKNFGIPLYLDGARLAYALASPQNDVTLADLARICDAFYIGGTKCGALMGEAVVIPDKGRIPHFFNIIKQHGALLAKGWLLGIQFDELFQDHLYESIGKSAIAYGELIKEALEKKNYKKYMDSPTNQIFFVISNEKLKELEQRVSYSYWEPVDEEKSVIRLCTSWATKKEDVEALIALL